MISGAGRGLGAAIARRLRDEGWTLSLGLRDTSRPPEGVEPGDRVLVRRFDATDPATAAAWTEATVGRFGRLDALVNNAGILRMVDFERGEESDLDDLWAVNVKAPFRLIRATLPHLRQSGRGRVVNIASTESILTTAGMVAYTATKAAVVGITKSFAVELGREGITVNCICPGPIRTGMTASIPDEDKNTYARRRVPLRRYGDPEEVAQMTLSMCLPAASFLNGAIVPVDGGMSIRHT